MSANSGTHKMSVNSFLVKPTLPAPIIAILKLITFTSIQSNARQGATEERMAARRGAHAIRAGIPALSPPRPLLDRGSFAFSGFGLCRYSRARPDNVYAFEGNFVLRDLIANGQLMRTISLPRGRQRLHAMPTSTG
jgi:hypothetical protein